MKTKKIKSILFFIFLYIFIDLSLTQLFFIKFYNSKLEKRHASDLENRILNKDYKYTFANKKIFKSNYQGHEYTIKTNNLGFRDFRVRDLDINNNYTIVIGDSMVEGVPFEFEDSLVGYLNQKLVNQQIEKHEFLNAGVASYSSYIYEKKIINVLDKNTWIKAKQVILLLDKSDVFDDLAYLDRPDYFSLEKKEIKIGEKSDFLNDLKKVYLWRFLYKQTTTGAFVKKIGDIIELELRDARDRYILSKKLEKNFFKITSKQVNSFRSINTKTYITNFFYGDLWETQGKESIDFSIENIINLKNYLDAKNIKFLVVLYPWSFEIADKIPRENYLNYIVPKLKKNSINHIITYYYFLNLEYDPYSIISDHYVYNDVHFNKNGYRILSDLIWENISNNYIQK